MVVLQGDLFWVNRRVPFGSEPGYRRPCVVIQNNLLNASKLNTVVVCALTTNLERAGDFGNVVLEKGEGNLLRTSVVNITQIMTVDKSRLTEKIGSLSFTRIWQITKGLEFLFRPRETGESVEELRAKYGSEIFGKKSKSSRKK